MRPFVFVLLAGCADVPNGQRSLPAGAQSSLAQESEPAEDTGAAAQPTELGFSCWAHESFSSDYYGSYEEVASFLGFEDDDGLRERYREDYWDSEVLLETHTVWIEDRPYLERYAYLYPGSEFSDTYTYDEHGIQLTSRFDEGMDGTIEVSSDATVEDGRIATVRVVDHGLAKWITYFYDAEGRLVRTEGDLGEDGTVDSYRTFTYPDEWSTFEQDDLDNDGVYDMTYLTVVDEEGRRTHAEWDQDPSTPEIDVVYDTVWSDDGVVESNATYPDGTVDQDLYAYDSRGREIGSTSQQISPTGAVTVFGTWTRTYFGACAE